MSYAELHCLSNFSFLRGASHPGELVQRAGELGYRALALTDECSLAGMVRAWEAAKTAGLALVTGGEFQLHDGPKVVLLAPTATAYAQLCALMTRARRRSRKGSYHLAMTDLGEHTGALLALWCPRWPARGLPADALAAELAPLRDIFGERLWIAWERHLHPEDRQRLALLERLGRRFGLPLLAAGDVHYHCPSRQALQDVMACIRAGCSIHDAHAPLFPNAERHLRPLPALRQRHPEALLRETLVVAERCTFDLGELRYEYPDETVPAGHSAISHLRQLVETGLRARWPQGCPAEVRGMVTRELALIEELGYEHYFLTVEDIVRFARSQGILCQGRGSAANSAVCYALGITAVDPTRLNLLFERFISRERNEPPDIDVDFEHERREEVIQYIYRKYGRERAALAATVICYRRRSAVCDVGKALGLAPDTVATLAGSLAWWDGDARLTAQLTAMGIALDSSLLTQLVSLVRQIENMPRHLSQHVGGFVIARDSLANCVPVENAAMPERTIIQWDRDDLGALGILKVDVLALGMLSALRRALALISDWRGRPLTLDDIPAEDPHTYAMICRGETTGVFQIESRAQMSMLPRLRPKCFMDLVIEVAIIRPGPIQGDMVHPYLRRREGKEPVVYPGEELRRVLEPTLGVPLFQEQVMSICMIAAGFSPGEADQVRRSMAAWKRGGELERFREKLLAGMQARGYDEHFASQIHRQILGFSSYGFPAGHAASFALLTYASCWLKCHEPAAFCAALLNSQPMGFYQPAQLVNDARRNGVCLAPVDVQTSVWDCSLEPDTGRDPRVRLGLRLVTGLPQDEARRLLAAREHGPFVSVDDLAQRAGLTRRALNALAEGGALQALAGHRHQARWAAAGVQRLDAVLQGAHVSEPALELPAPSEGQSLVADYRGIGLTLGRHPLALLRGRLARLRVVTAERLRQLRDGSAVRVAGIVTHRQRPETASGVIFATLEDETGMTNLVIWPRVLETQREAVLGARLMVVSGRLQSEQGVVHVVARRVEDYSRWLGALHADSRDFH